MVQDKQGRLANESHTTFREGSEVSTVLHRPYYYPRYWLLQDEWTWGMKNSPSYYGVAEIWTRDMLVVVKHHTYTCLPSVTTVCVCLLIILRSCPRRFKALWWACASMRVVSCIPLRFGCVTLPKLTTEPSGPCAWLLGTPKVISR